MSKPKMRRVFKIILVMVAVFVLTLVILVAARMHFLLSPTEPSVREISERYAIKFPRSAKTVNSYLSPPGAVRRLLAKIEMDRADVHSWIVDLQKTGRCEMSTSDIDKRITRVPKMAFKWWIPGHPRHFISMIVEPDDLESPPYSVSMLINLDTGKRVTVYMYHST